VVLAGPQVPDKGRAQRSAHACKGQVNVNLYANVTEEQQVYSAIWDSRADRGGVRG
jgi:hypothetical protein